MNYETTISSKGQITIPVEVRRKLALGKKINMTLSGQSLVLSRKPDLDDMWDILNQTGKGAGLSVAESANVQHLLEKDRKNRGY